MVPQARDTSPEAERVQLALLRQAGVPRRLALAQALTLPSAEDMILAKLEWYRLGGETSDRQWSDILGMLKVQGAGLDLAYLRQTAPQLGVSDLLERALVEGGLAQP